MRSKSAASWRHSDIHQILGKKGGLTTDGKAKQRHRRQSAVSKSKQSLRNAFRYGRLERSCKGGCELHLFLDGARILTTNQLERLHRPVLWSYKKTQKAAIEDCLMLALRRPLPLPETLFHGKVVISILRRAKRDVDGGEEGYPYKAMIDALTEANIIQDDSKRYVSFERDFEKGSNALGIRIRSRLKADRLVGMFNKGVQQ